MKNKTIIYCDSLALGIGDNQQLAYQNAIDCGCDPEGLIDGNCNYAVLTDNAAMRIWEGDPNLIAGDIAKDLGIA